MRAALLGKGWDVEVGKQVKHGTFGMRQSPLTCRDVTPAAGVCLTDPAANSNMGSLRHSTTTPMCWEAAHYFPLSGYCCVYCGPAAAVQDAQRLQEQFNWLFYAHTSPQHSPRDNTCNNPTTLHFQGSGKNLKNSPGASQKA